MHLNCIVPSFDNSRQAAIRLGQILIRKGLIDSQRLESVLIWQRQACLQQPLGELLISQGLIAKPDLESALQEQYWRQSGFWVID